MMRRTALSTVLALATGRAFALYDPEPDAALAAAQGEWKGTLTYRDYSQPDRLVTLPTRLFVALSAPSVWVLHFVFDDGPNKTVFSYERMSFDFAAKQIAWASGAAAKSVDTHAITDRTTDGSTTRLNFERPAKGGTERHALLLSPQRFQLTNEEVPASGDAVLRNRYELTRVAP